MARKMNLSVPTHPTIETFDPPISMRRYASAGAVPVARVTCPECGAQRWYPYGTLRQWAAKPGFTGRCRVCSMRKTGREGKNGGRTERRVTTSGYVNLYLKAMKTDEDRDLFNAMKTKAFAVFEHRFVMAKHLGRPLESWECVDHMDGDKLNNSVDNLRVYVRGKQQPGSCPGYGTYYHEWQMALREIERLKQESR